MPLDIVAIRDRYNTLKVTRANFDTLWQEIADHVVPTRARIQDMFSPGTKTTFKLYDGTAPHALTIATSALHSSLTPSTLQWFSLALRDQELMDDDEVAVWLDDCAKRMFAAFNQSNFDAEMQEVGSDLFAFGTACLFATEKEPKPGRPFTGLRFECVPPGQYVIAENADGFVDTVFRCRLMSVRAAAQQFGVERLSETSRDKFEKGRLDEMIEIVQGIFPRKDQPTDPNADDSTAPTKRPIASIYFELAGAHLIEVSGFSEMPYMVPRWRKISGEEYGRSPVMNALPDIRTLNEAVKLRLMAWNLAVAPPILQRDRGVTGDVRMVPRGTTFVRDMDAVREFITQARFDVANFSEEQLRGQINAALYVDQIQLAARTGTPISATEAAIRFETMQRILGPTVSRMQAELIAPLINRVFRIMARRGQFLPPPAILAEGGDDMIDIVYEGPMARAQRSNDVDAIIRFTSVIFPMAEAHPEVLDPVDFTEMTRIVARATGLPPTLLHDSKKVDQSRQARVQSQQAQAQQESFVNITGAISKAAPLIEMMRQQPGPQAPNEPNTAA